jgi:hypothetical protein
MVTEPVFALGETVELLLSSVETRFQQSVRVAV